MEYIKNCRSCGKDFMANHSGRMYCGDFCKRDMINKAMRKKNRSKRKAETKKECVICKKIFLTRLANQITCSKECGEKRQKFNNKNRPYLRLRFEVFKRDNFTCQYCGRNVKDDKIKIRCDHIIPINGVRYDKANNELKNLTTSCWECNDGKRDILLTRKYYK